MRTLLLALATCIVACGKDAGRPTEEKRIEVRRAGAVVSQLPIEATDLWSLCEPQIEAVRVRAGATFVTGACVARDDQDFDLARAPNGKAVATLSNALDHGELARATAVTSIELVTRSADAAPLSSLAITSPVRPPVTLTDADLEGLRARKRKAGIPLRAVLERAGVTPQKRIVIRGTTEYEIQAALLADPEHVMTLRRNHRGQLRFGDEAIGRASRVADVTEIVVE